MQPENIGKQFEDIIGNNFTGSEIRKAKRSAINAAEMGEVLGNVVGAGLANDYKTGETVDGDSEPKSKYGELRKSEIARRLSAFPSDMHGTWDKKPAIVYVSPKGWTHVWHGESHMQHHPNGVTPTYYSYGATKTHNERLDEPEELTLGQFYENVHEWERRNTHEAWRGKSL